MTRMCRMPVVAGVLAVLASVLAARADTLKYADGGQARGMIDGVNFAVDGLPNFYRRDNLTAITLTEEGKDTLTVADGGKREGKLLSVRLKTGEGILAVARRQLSAIELKVEEIEEARPAESQPEAKPKQVLSPEQEAAEAKNKDLRTEYNTKANEEFKKFGAKEAGLKALEDRITQLNTSIQTKLQQRTNRENQPTRTDGRGRQQNIPYNDGLDKDQGDLAKAQDDRTRMIASLRAEKAKIMARVHEKEKRVQRAYGENHKAIVANNVPSEEAMVARYKAALDTKDAGGKVAPKDAGEKADRKEKAAAKEEE